MDSVLGSRKPIPEMKSHSPLKQSWLLLLLLFFKIDVRLHFITPLEFYACACITASSEQQ